MELQVIVLDSAWEAHLPEIIEAVLDGPGARQVHADFLEYYGRTADQTPLVAYGKGGFRDVS